MVVFDKDDVVKGTITFPKEDIPSAEFFMKKTITVAEDDEVSITGNYTSDGATAGEVVFAGRVDDVDLEDAQKVKVISKAEEIDVIRPDGDYGGYTEVLLGELITDLCAEITVPKTESTAYLEPNETVDQGLWNDDIGGNGDNELWDEIDDGAAPNDATYINSVITGTKTCEIGFEIDSLSGDYNYIIYRVDIELRHKWLGDTSSSAGVRLHDGTDWSDMETAPANAAFDTDTFSFTGLQLTQDDIGALKVELTAFNLGITLLQVSNMRMKIYYRYYPTLQKATYKSTQNYKGEQTLRQIFEWAKLQELFTWYLDPSLEFQFNDGSVDSGVDISNTDKIKRITGTKQIKNFDKVELLGGISTVTGAQISATAGAGDIIFKDTYTNIRDVTILGNLASQILSNKNTYPLTVQMYRYDPTKGMIQPGEEVTINAGINFSKSSRTITAGQYIVDKTKYYISDGVYTDTELTFSDGLVFRKKEEVNLTQENSALINQLAVYSGSGVSVLNDIDDVTIAGVADNEFLVYDAGTSTWINQTAAEAEIPLDSIANPAGDKEFNFANKHLHFKWVAPAAGAHQGAFEIEATGAFQNDLVHIHQHTGNPGATNLVYIEAEDDDVVELFLAHGTKTFSFGKDGLVLSQTATISFDAEQNDTTYSGICIDIDTTGCNLFDLVYVDAADSVAPADADDINKLPAIGIVVAAGKVLIHGVVKDDDLIKCTTPKAIVYASLTLREVTETIPPDAGDYVQVVGVCVGDHTLFVNISLDIVKRK